MAIHEKTATRRTKSFTLLNNLTTFTYSFFRRIIYCMASVFIDVNGRFQVFQNKSNLLQTCSALSLPADCTEGCSNSVSESSLFPLWNSLFLALLRSLTSDLYLSPNFFSIILVSSVRSNLVWSVILVFGRAKDFKLVLKPTYT